MKPLIYVAAVRRTGSTMMAELLSDPPAAYVFREPRLPLGKLILKDKGDAREILALHGVRVGSLPRKMAELAPLDAIRAFRAFCEGSSDRVEQFGVKEIMHEGWDRIGTVFPEMRVVVTVRDPRDIFLSMWHKRERLARRGRNWMDPEVLAEDVNRESARIEEMIRRFPHLVVRYEEICRDPGTIETVRSFAENGSRGLGLLGRTSEWNKQAHGITLTASRVELWKQESDPEAIARLQKAAQLMEPYARAWGYA